MHVAILGAAGFLGRKLASRLMAESRIGPHPIASLTLFDLAPPTAPETSPFPVRPVQGDVADLPEAAIPSEADIVFYLAAVVSAQAEADYHLGLRVNLLGALTVAERCRKIATARGGRGPRLVFTSSVATFSGDQASVMGDDARQVPANSYGAQKAAAELLLGDASRRGFLDLIALRLPTIVVRPGRPNRAASGFFSSIIREPLLGLEAELPVSEDFAAWLASPRRAVDWLLHAATIPTDALGLARGINPPGITVTVREMLRALDQVRPGANALVRHVPDPAISVIVETWPARFESRRARALGFAEHETFPDVIRAFIEDDLEATRAERAQAS
jgi:nucleoside-diphosphate-sugar epimerase